MKNWFGLYCDQCGKIIPCLINLTSLIVLVVTAPLWYWFKEPLKRKWLAVQAHRYANPVLTDDGNSFAGNGWIKEGLSFGFFMFVVMAFIMNPLFNDEPITWKTMLSGIIMWLISGLLFGYLMKIFNGKPKQVQPK